METGLAENRMANVGLWQDDTYFCPCLTSNKLNELPWGKSPVISHEMPPEDLAFQIVCLLRVTEKKADTLTQAGIACWLIQVDGHDR